MTRHAFTPPLVSALGAALLLTILPLAPAQADDVIQVSSPASTSDTGAWATVSVPIAQGQTPTSVSGRVGTTATSGQVQLRVGSTTLKTLTTSKTGEFDLELDQDVLAELDQSDGTANLDISARWVPEQSEGRCLASEPEQVELSDIQVQVKGTAQVPESVAAFFAAQPKSVSVTASDDAADAALTAVPALAAAFPDADVAWDATQAELNVNFALAAEDSGLTFDLDQAGTTLTVTGSAEQLAGLDSVIRTDAVTLATGRTASAAVQEAEATRWAPPTELSFADLGVSDPKLEGYGQSSIYLGVDESSFGSSLEGMSIHLTGTHSDIPEGTEAALNAYWNDTLVGSWVLEAGDTAIDADLDVPAGILQPRNGLRLQLDAATSGADCYVAGSLPIQVHLDGQASTLTPQYGTGTAAGFQLLPQTAGGQLGLALGDTATSGTDPQAERALATGLLAALQQSSAVPLQVQLLDESEVADSALSTVVVGAQPETADELGAPLRLEQMRTINAEDLSAGVGTDSAYAVLEAFTHRGRTVLLAGGWQPEQGTADQSSALYADLTHSVLASEGGWASLSRNLLIAQPDADPVLLESNAVVPQDSVTDDYRVYGWWAAAGVAVLILAGLGGWWAYRRANRRARAQAAAEAQAVAQAAPAEPNEAAGKDTTGKNTAGDDN